MIDDNFVKHLATKWQTNEINVLREYLQHLFLANLYQSPSADKIYLKGGTALRIIYNSPRFSEDLDFNSEIIKLPPLEKIIEGTLLKLELNNIPVEITEAKPTSGGYFFNATAKINQNQLGLKLNFSTRKKSSGETVLINSDFLPPYTLIGLETDHLVTEKIEALLTRQKDRDFFDLYFALRSRIGIEKIIEKKTELKQLVDQRTASFKELKIFLPASFTPIAKNLKTALLSELQKL